MPSRYKAPLSAGSCWPWNAPGKRPWTTSCRRLATSAEPNAPKGRVERRASGIASGVRFSGLRPDGLHLHRSSFRVRCWRRHSRWRPAWRGGHQLARPPESRDFVVKRARTSPNSCGARTECCSHGGSLVATCFSLDPQTNGLICGLGVPGPLTTRGEVKAPGHVRTRSGGALAYEWAVT